MAASPKRICWDACSWIAYIQQEKIYDVSGQLTEDRYSLCRSVLELAEKGKVEIIISGLCLVEVCKSNQVTGLGYNQIESFFENDFIVVAPVDTYLGGEARKLMCQGYSGLKPPDATHLSAALITNADELHTFDQKLLDLDGLLTKQDGTALTICKPAHGGAPLPLMQAADEAEEISSHEQPEAPTEGEGVSDSSEQIPDGEVQGSSAGGGEPTDGGGVREEAATDSEGAGGEEEVDPRPVVDPNSHPGPASDSPKPE